jgi:hypothetical protein
VLSERILLQNADAPTRLGGEAAKWFGEVIVPSWRHHATERMGKPAPKLTARGVTLRAFAGVARRRAQRPGT